jgi:hypothetical protein
VASEVDTRPAPGAENALAALDAVLAAKPHADGHLFSSATHELSLLRDAMAVRQRRVGTTTESRRRLEHVNAAISVVLAGLFPLGSIPWLELELARDWLAKLATADAGKK